MKNARTRTTALPARCNHAGASARIRRLLRKSTRPATAARTPITRPANSNQAEKSAHIISAVFQYATSVTSVPTKQTIGNGTSIGWMGWLAMRAVEAGFARAVTGMTSCIRKPFDCGFWLWLQPPVDGKVPGCVRARPNANPEGTPAQILGFNGAALRKPEGRPRTYSLPSRRLR